MFSMFAMLNGSSLKILALLKRKVVSIMLCNFSMMLCNSRYSLAANNELQKDPREGYFSSERAAFSTSSNCRHGYKQKNIFLG